MSFELTEENRQRAQKVAKMERSLLMEAVLEQVWGERLTRQRIQGELDRIVHTDLSCDGAPGKA